MTSIDLNADIGESFGRYELPGEEELLGLVTSANVAPTGTLTNGLDAHPNPTAHRMMAETLASEAGSFVERVNARR